MHSNDADELRDRNGNRTCIKQSHPGHKELELKLINGLDLFSGIGGLSISLKEWVRPIAYCEIDPYCQGTLLSRMHDGSLQPAPIWDDIRTLNGQSFLGFVDIIFAGFPCQDISITGHGKGLEGERSGLFFEIVRLCSEIKPRFIFLENVPAITCRGGTEVVRQITALGYDCRWCVISAQSVGAAHKRERWFLMANTKGKRSQKIRQSMRTKEGFPLFDSSIKYESWNPEPENKFRMVGMANGVQDRTHRIKALGNAVVPAQAKEAFKILMGLA